MQWLGMRLTHGKAMANFFDRPAVVRSVDRATLRVCRIAGYRVRQSARKSLKVRPYRAERVKARMITSGRIVYGAAAAGAIRRGTAELVEQTAGSPAGQPPIAHDKEGLRRIFYSWDATLRATVVGPVLFGKKVSGKTIPELHEFGGNVMIGERSAKYPKRPFMRPALEKHIPDLPELWREALSKH